MEAEGRSTKGPAKDKEDKRRKKLEDQLTQLGVKMWVPGLNATATQSPQFSEMLCVYGAQHSTQLGVMMWV